MDLVILLQCDCDLKHLVDEIRIFRQILERPFEEQELQASVHSIRTVQTYQTRMKLHISILSV